MPCRGAGIEKSQVGRVSACALRQKGQEEGEDYAHAGRIITCKHTDEEG